MGNILSKKQNNIICLPNNNIGKIGINDRYKYETIDIFLNHFDKFNEIPNYTDKYSVLRYLISLLLYRYSKNNTNVVYAIRRNPAHITSCIIVEFLGNYFFENNFDENNKLLTELSLLFNCDTFLYLEELDTTPILFEIYNQTDNLSGIRLRYHQLLMYFYNNCPKLIKFHKGKYINNVIINQYLLNNNNDESNNNESTIDLNKILLDNLQYV